MEEVNEMLCEASETVIAWVTAVEASKLVEDAFTTCTRQVPERGAESTPLVMEQRVVPSLVTVNVRLLGPEPPAAANVMV
jgi:hypothetical protein